MESIDHDSFLRSTIKQLASDFADRSSTDNVLRQVCETAIQLIPAADHASVLHIHGGEYDSIGATSATMLELDAAQQRFSEGPCLDAALADVVIRSNDLETETRWPRFSQAAIDVGVRSMLSFQLYTRHKDTGALNLASSEANAFDADDEAIGAMLATHAATALISANTHQNFRSALATRDVIGQAKGIIMERFGVDAVRAFELLTRLSQESNAPIREIANKLVSQAGTAAVAVPPK